MNLDNKLPIGEIEIRTAQQTLTKYMAGKQKLDQRIIDNEDWYKLQHWKDFKESKVDRVERSATAWIFNNISNKHADAMDAYPEPAVLPQAEDDRATAKILSSIIPVIMDNCGFESTYSESWWDKLKHGAVCYGVLWDKDAAQGIGDIAITAIDMLSIYWEPGITDIQDSRNIFILKLVDNDILVQEYPELEGMLGQKTIDKKQYHYDDTVDTTGKSVVVDWYYKVKLPSGATCVHFVKYVDEHVLFATENDEAYSDGLYAHGQYPFVMDVLYPEKGTPAGFGLIDIGREPQEYIDRVGSAIRVNSEEAARRRYFVKDNAGINEEEFNNIDNRIIHCAGSVNDDNVKPVETPLLNSIYLSVLQDKVNELKETSSNRDFNQGGTASGVTAASAIQALQETGNKTSRDMIKTSYRAYSKICELIIELIRQFYDVNRTFRIVGESGEYEFVSFNNAGLQSSTVSVAGLDFQTKEPHFDIKIKAQKSSMYSKLSQNELALQLYNLGFFNPQLVDQVLPCIDMMDFDGKDKVRQSISRNGDMYQQLQKMQQMLAMTAQALAEKGDPRVLEALSQQSAPVQTASVPKSTNKIDMGEIYDQNANTKAL